MIEMPDHIKGQHVLKMNNFAFVVKIIIRFGTKIKRIHLSLHWAERRVSWLVYNNNILMGDDGRVKITDMGLACKITAGLHGACGTRGYWAPEMLRRDSKGKRKSYGHTVDWFSFGCMIAEFISGINPFRSQKALNFGQARGHTTKEKALDWIYRKKTESSVFDTPTKRYSSLKST